MKTILVDAVYCFIVEKEGQFVIFQEMYDLLESYPNKKIILTNAGDDKIKLYGLDNMPYQVFTLKHNPEKTNPEYYQIMLENLNLKPDEVIYFEHNTDSVRSAQSKSINTYFYDENVNDLVKLKKFLDENL